MVAFAGAVPTSQRLKQIHQTLDSVDLCKPITKYSAEIDSSESISEVVSNAFRAAEGDRPGASFVSVPMDIMNGSARCTPLTTTSYSHLGPADPDALDEAARLINTSQRPVILLGMMASNGRSAAAIRELLKRFSCPVTGTFQAAGALSVELLANFAGRVGQLANRPGDKFLKDADLVITIGYNPIEYGPEYWNLDNARPVIHVDVLRADIDMHYNPAVELLGDLASTLTLLVGKLEKKPIDAGFQQMLRETGAERSELFAKARALTGSPVHPMRLIVELQQFFRPDVTVCSDMGSFSLWLSRYLYSFEARQFLITNGQQTLGVALPWAIAATLVRPNEKVLSISGDGGFLFSAMELETAVRLKSHLVHMVWIDGTYDMVGVQELEKYGRESAVAFGPVDVVKYADAFGAKGLMISTPDDITPVLRQAFEIEGPVLIGVHVDYSDNHVLFENVLESSIV
jgi:acetolactate synthase-1/2/3 large subunit